MIKLTWAMTARYDLVHIRAYIQQHNPAAARAVALRILEATDLLPHYPELGSRTRIENVRRLVVRHSPYIIYYKFDDAGIEILEIYDGRREVPRSLAQDDCSS